MTAYGSSPMDPNSWDTLSPAVLGPDGKPARLTQGQRDDALVGAYDSIFAGAYRFAGYTPDALISSKGFQILDDQLTQVPVAVGLNTVRNAVLAKGWQVQPYAAKRGAQPSPRAQKMADHLTYCLNNIVDDAGFCYDFRHILFELDYAVHTGFRVSEIVWRTLREGDYAGSWGFAEIAAKPCKQIGWQLDTKTLKVNNITSYTPATGYQFNAPPEKFLRYTFRGKDNLPHGNGVGRAVYKHTWSKDNLTRFWNISLEVFGTPFILAKAPPGRAMALAQAALSQIRAGSTAVLPNNVEAELLSVAQYGKSAFMEAVSYHDQQIILGYLHSTLTAGEGQDHGTQSLGQVHQDTSAIAHGFVRTDTEGVLNNQLVRRWVIYNYGNDALAEAPRISLGDWDAVDMQNLTNAFGSLVSMGNMHESNPEIRERLKLSPPTPEEQQALKQKQAEAKAAAQAKQTGSAVK